MLFVVDSLKALQRNELVHLESDVNEGCKVCIMFNRMRFYILTCAHRFPYIQLGRHTEAAIISFTSRWGPKSEPSRRCFRLFLKRYNKKYRFESVFHENECKPSTRKEQAKVKTWNLNRFLFGVLFSCYSIFPYPKRGSFNYSSLLHGWLPVQFSIICRKIGPLDFSRTWILSNLTVKSR